MPPQRSLFNKIMAWLIDHYYVVIVVIAIIAFFRATNGFSPSLVEKHKAIYDPMLKKYRCIDKDTGEMMDLQPPCIQPTKAGLEAVLEKQRKCEERGGNPDRCFSIASQWLFAKAQGIPVAPYLEKLENPTGRN